MAKGTIKSDQRKKLLLAVLGLLFVVVIAYNFIGGSSSPTQSDSNANRPALSTKKPGADKTARRPSNNEERLAWVNEQLANTEPLDLRKISNDTGPATPSEKRGNIFVYVPPPPPKPVEPPKPPPIMIQPPQLLRNVVAGSPFKVEVIVFGSSFPPDATIYFGGSPKPTKRVGENRLSTELLPQEYSSPINIQVDVKSQSDPAKLYSNVMSINIPEIQQPNIVYQGRLGAGASIENLGVSASSLDRNKVVFKGQTVQGVWRLEVVDDKYIELVHTQLEVKVRKQIKNKTP